VDARTARR